MKLTEAVGNLVSVGFFFWCRLIATRKHRAWNERAFSHSQRKIIIWSFSSTWRAYHSQKPFFWTNKSHNYQYYED